MKVEIIYCDICGKEGALTSTFYTDRRMDPAGAMDDIHEHIDLCHSCTWTAYKTAEKEYGMECGKKVYLKLAAKVRARNDEYQK